MNTDNTVIVNTAASTPNVTETEPVKQDISESMSTLDKQTLEIALVIHRSVHALNDMKKEKGERLSRPAVTLALLTEAALMVDMNDYVQDETPAELDELAVAIALGGPRGMYQQITALCKAVRLVHEVYAKD